MFAGVSLLSVLDVTPSDRSLGWLWRAEGGGGGEDISPPAGAEFGNEGRVSKDGDRSSRTGLTGGASATSVSGGPVYEPGIME